MLQLTCPGWPHLAFFNRFLPYIYIDFWGFHRISMISYDFLRFTMICFDFVDFQWFQTTSLISADFLRLFQISYKCWWFPMSLYGLPGLLVSLLFIDRWHLQKFLRLLGFPSEDVGFPRIRFRFRRLCSYAACRSHAHRSILQMHSMAIAGGPGDSYSFTGNTNAHAHKHIWWIHIYIYIYIYIYIWLTTKKQRLRILYKCIVINGPHIT